MTIYRLYLLTGLVGAIGFVWYFLMQGPAPAAGFLLGAVGSFGNLWLFDWLSRAIAPGTASRKPWQAGVFVTRYLLLFAAGYVIVNALDVNPLPVILGLFASTAAVLTSSILELVSSLLGSRSAH